jgi:hypothetical protein
VNLRIFRFQGAPQRAATATERQQILETLDELERLLRAGEKIPDRLRLPPPIALDGASAHRVKKTAELYWEKGGSGISYWLPALLRLVASHPSEELLPFWEHVTPLRKVARRQDVSAEERAWIAMQVLTTMIGQGSRAAQATWLQILPQLRPLDRGELLRETLTRLPQPQAVPFLALARTLATEDPALETRYVLRRLLVTHGESFPLEPLEGEIEFELKGSKFSCLLGLRSADTLFALHEAIQRALNWDNDHLWCFFVGAQREGPLRWPAEEVHGCEERVLADSDPHPRAARPGEFAPEQLGELGLRVGDKLLYHFDFGDNHLFELRVAALRNQKSPKTRYPILTIKKGKPPRQYDFEPED